MSEINMKKLIIIGAGGFGREVADTVRRINAANIDNTTYELLGFVDDAEYLVGKEINDVKVLGDKRWLKTYAQTQKIYGVIAIANAKIKKEMVAYLAETILWENIIDPTALVSPYAQLGEGNIIQPFVVIGPNAKIGSHCMFNIRSSLGHDAKAEDYVSVMSVCDITGGAVLKCGSYLATSVAIVPQTIVGENAFICAGSVVLKDVEEDAKMIGYPAKRIK